MKFIQYTNSSIGAVAASTTMPLGIVTQKAMCAGCDKPTFNGTTSNIDVVNLNEAGKYRITYSASVQAAAAGNAVFSLIVNNVVVDSTTVTTTASGYSDVSLDYVVRVCNNCSSLTTNFPATVQIKLDTVALTGGNSNLIIKKIA